MNNLANRLIVPVLFVVVAFIVILMWSTQAATELRDPRQITGWSLAAVIFFLLIFSVRKKLSAFNLGSARIWFAFHVAVGFLAIGFFIVHTGSFWPKGLYEIVKSEMK